ncbi:epoxide hydrolase 1-like [Glandiceps talaboti]
MGRKLTIAVVLVAIATCLYLGGLLTSPPPPPQYGDGWWGRGEKSRDKEDTTIKKFGIKVDDSVLEDLKLRLEETRMFGPLGDTRFHYGVNPKYMNEVVLKYWQNSYDWRKQEQFLNQYNHFKTTIEGIDIHFVHVKPKDVTKQNVKPLLMIHGWPGSFMEFYKIIPMLTDPVNHGGTEDDTFEVICPSIPGFGFSEDPHQRGFDTLAAARIFDKLMTRIGFDKYFVQGGDWGSLIGSLLSRIQPSHVLGYHTNTPFCLPPLYGWKMAVGSVFPSLVVDKEDIEYVFPLSKRAKILTMESGHFHIHTTKPDSSGHALTDSPVGLAAYLIEKFSTWTDQANLDLEDGGLQNYFTLDELLTNVMIYWINGNIASSCRLYKESLPKAFHDLTNCRVKVPTGISVFKNDIIRLPETWAKQVYPDLISYTRVSAGGHFPAFEVPQLLAQDIRQFVRKSLHKK